MCTQKEAYFRALEWVDKHRVTITMVMGFVVAWYVGNLYENNNKMLVSIMEKQAAAQMETAKALQEMAVRQAETNSRLADIERKQ
ncbi:hypothetical protein QET93_007880 [Akkermansia sp. N21116]|uniref:hypothetical protein n=1 Tax=Akkermansia sp. N21116 TaxID=3040764 RepID=UPI00244EC6D8|nr:hypothetical protein [Akkermansia sp. N21116]WPX39455.1 hypothetical protein QET93_007880 [Akkermansia sp. N21116]